jgi:uncharacterized BrkB/YihY/UPF0761 family membrane protein
LAGWVRGTRQRAVALRERSRTADFAFTLATRPNWAHDTLLTSYLALRIFILLFPLAYMAVAGIGLYSANVSSPDQAAKDAGLSGSVAASVASAARGSSRGHLVVLAVGLVLTLMTARNAVRALRIAHASIWRVPVPKVPITDPGGPAFAGTVLLGAWMGIIVTRLRNAGAPIGLTSIVFAAIVATIWTEISWRLPHGPVRRRDLIPGAVLVGIGAPALNLATQVYFAPKLARATETYGVLGASLVILTYLLVLAWTIVAGAELNASLADWRRRG